MIYTDPIKAMNLAVHELRLLKDANPSVPFHTTQLGYIYSIMQEFPKAAAAYQEQAPTHQTSFASSSVYGR